MGKLVLTKLHNNGKQKRLNVPKQEETKDWIEGDIIILNKLKEDKI